jgi:cytoplasmic iron level regulating protein YaaA (DUF328/UPF0246 family)
MLVILSPAKRLDFSAKTDSANYSQPVFLKDTKLLVGELKHKTPKQLSKLMGISEKLAVENAARYSQVKFPLNTSNAKEAIFAFQGDTYQGLSISKFSEEDLAQAQLRIRILSGLFGVLAPQDLIFPYRLEMGTKFGIGKVKDLYGFWREKVTDHLNDLENEYLVNCASEEYFSVIDKKRIKAKIITPIFLDREKGTSGKYKNIGFFAKRARGMFSRFIILEKIKEPNQLLNFNFEGYTFDKSQSKEDRPVFKREFIRKTK